MRPTAANIRDNFGFYVPIHGEALAYGLTPIRRGVLASSQVCGHKQNSCSLFEWNNLSSAEIVHVMARLDDDQACPPLTSSLPGSRQSAYYTADDMLEWGREAVRFIHFHSPTSLFSRATAYTYCCHTFGLSTPTRRTAPPRRLEEDISLVVRGSIMVENCRPPRPGHDVNVPRTISTLHTNALQGSVNEPVSHYQSIEYEEPSAACAFQAMFLSGPSWSRRTSTISLRIGELLAILGCLFSFVLSESINRQAG